MIGREVRDLGDAVLLHDASDREPFWNRLAGVDWPTGAAAFDRRLTEALALFAGLDRIPHVWPMPGYDEPPDLMFWITLPFLGPEGAAEERERTRLSMLET